MSELSEIGINFSTYLAKSSPQVINNSLQWYLAGSLATTIMAGAEEIKEIELDEKNNIKEEKETKKITEEQRKKMAIFSRKLGQDIDVVNVNGNLYTGASINNKPHIKNVIEKVPNVLELMSWNQTYGGTMYIDYLEKDTYHKVTKIKTANGDVYITAPPEQLAHKLNETIWLSSRIAGNNATDKTKTKYQKDIKDLSIMFYGFKDLYEKNEFFDRIYNVLNANKKSFFSIQNPLYNSDNIMEGQEILDVSIMKRIIEDTDNYLKDITDDKSALEINEFLNGLLNRRKKEAEIISENKSVQNLTPLEQREKEKSSLENIEKVYNDVLSPEESKNKDTRGE